MSCSPDSAPSPRSPAPSPCINLCQMDATRTLCLGCRRTLAEIAGWSRMDDAARHQVLALLPTRALPPR